MIPNTNIYEGTPAGTVKKTFSPENWPVLLYADGLAGAEEIDIEIMSATATISAAHPIDAADADFMTYQDGEGNDVKLTATKTMVRLDLPANYRLVIPVTAGAIKVGMY